MQVFFVEFLKPHWQGFMAASRVKSHGAGFEAVRERIVASIGCRRATRFFFENSGSSSKNKIPLCASESSPGCEDLSVPMRVV